MRIYFVFAAFLAFSLLSSGLSAQPAAASTAQGKENLYIDVHHMGPGKVKYADVAKAHAKDLATQKKYGVHFIKYWVDEAGGNIYCLSSSVDSQSIRRTHAEAHGLLPDQIFQVTDGQEAMLNGGKNFFLDVHELGAGNVTAKDVAGAHQKDLATQQKYGVNFINYWVDEKDGRVLCLSQAADSADVIKTHKEAHGLIPAYVMKVKEGQ
ncbi:MAG TPA: DUF4242 domain-containing protein [Puia sp.]|nr:DUF4242 domain-containing protein [Puia sp.]